MQVDVPEKLALTLFFILLAIAGPWYINAGAIILVVLLRLLASPFRPSSERSKRGFAKILITLFGAALLMTLANGVFIKEGEIITQVWVLSIYSGGLEFGLRVASRLLLIAAAILLFFGSTPLSRIAAFLHHAGLPSQVVMTFLLTLYFIGQLPDRIERIFTAQEARGARVRSHVFARFGSFASIFSPLLLSSMVESVDRGMALELRGFHGTSRLSFGSESHKHRTTSAFTIFFLSLSFICLLWILFQWLRP